MQPNARNVIHASQLGWWWWSHEGGNINNHLIW